MAFSYQKRAVLRSSSQQRSSDCEEGNSASGSSPISLAHSIPFLYIDPVMVDAQPHAASRGAMSGWISIGHVILSWRGLSQNLLRSGLKRFGLRPRLSRFNLLARQLRFQFRAQLGGTVLGLLKAGGMM
jgi:hypothetical protein